MKYTIIGNCQAYALHLYLDNNIVFKNKYNYIHVEPVHSITECDILKLYNSILPELDLILIQPINNNYRNDVRLSTNNILNNVNNQCIKILFPSCYFAFYQPFLQYIMDISFENTILNKPCDYHDTNLIKLFVDNPNNEIQTHYENYKNILCDQNLVNFDYLQNIYNNWTDHG